jgi:hypothetical protein
MSQTHQTYASTHAQATSTHPHTYTYDCTFTNNEAVADVYAHDLVCKYVYHELHADEVHGHMHEVHADMALHLHVTCGRAVDESCSQTAKCEGVESSNHIICRVYCTKAGRAHASYHRRPCVSVCVCKCLS